MKFSKAVEKALDSALEEATEAVGKAVGKAVTTITESVTTHTKKAISMVSKAPKKSPTAAQTPPKHPRSEDLALAEFLVEQKEKDRGEQVGKQAFDLQRDKLRYEHERFTQESLLKMAKVSQNTSNPKIERTTAPSWKELVVKKWSTSDVFEFIQEALELPDLATDLLRKKVDGSDIHAHLSGAQFNVSQFFDEMNMVVSERYKAMFKRRLERAADK